MWLVPQVAGTLVFTVSPWEFFSFFLTFPSWPQSLASNGVVPLHEECDHLFFMFPVSHYGTCSQMINI